MAKNKETITLMPFYQDLGASAVLGAIAGIFAGVVANSLGILNKTFFGITINPVVVFSLFVFICMAGIVVGRIIAKFIPLMYNVVKFGEAGGLNWLVDLGVVNLLVLLTNDTSNLSATIFKGISFTVAVTNSYFWNKLWVFAGHKKQNQTQEVGKFLLASLMGLVFNLVVFTFIKVGGPTVYNGITPGQWISIGTVIGSLSAMIFNFTLYKIWVFKS